MIETLLTACDKQHKGILFGPQDIKGSMIALINRGLIANHLLLKKGKNISAWYVTEEAIELLKVAGINILC